ncbi:MAG: FkbM family methyltransferase [Thiohalocapsa sp.]
MSGGFPYIEPARTRPDYGMQVEILVSLIYHFFVRPGDKVVDGGAAGAAHTVPLSRLVAPTGKVYAFEASPPVAAWLDTYLAGLDTAACIDLRATALGNRAATVEFIVDRAHPGMSHVRRGGESAPEIAQDRAMALVPMVTLDEALRNQGPITFMKLDLEGMDFLALRGGIDLIMRDRPLIVFENARPNEPDEYFGFFDAIGYDVYDVHNILLTRDNWRSAGVSYEAICGPRGGHALAQARILSDWFWRTLAQRPLLSSWEQVRTTCLDCLGYILDQAVP